jgi:hypothetical protein
MAEVEQAKLRTGERVRYVGEPGPAGEGPGTFVLLAPGMAGHVIEVKDGRCRVMFGGHAVWVAEDSLRPD